jgi:excisionase family DNA binding protein
MKAKRSAKSQTVRQGRLDAISARPDKPLTKAELATFLGVSERFIELEMARGRLTAVRFSPRLVRFRKVDVDLWMSLNSTSSMESAK